MKNISVSLDQVAPGHKCFEAIRDVHGRVLIGGGNHLTQTLLRGLESRGVSIVSVSARDLAAFKRSHGRQSIKPPTFTGNTSVAGGRTLTSRRTRRCCEAYSTERAAWLAEECHACLTLVEEIGQDIPKLSKPALAELCRLPQQLSSMLVEDTDQTLATYSVELPQFKLAQRATKLSVLAMAVAIEMGLDDADVMLLGNAALLHDLSLFEMPQHYCDPAVPLTNRELVEYRTHPARTIELVGDHPYVSTETRELILQVHRLPDGSGFPRMDSSDLHDLSSVLHCVEIYLALVNPAPGRKSMVPHDALGLMLHHTRPGTVDAGVLRSMIYQLALFPIASQVKLDNGQQATVLRRYEDQYHAPVVLPDGQATDDILFLADSDRTIVEPVPNSHEARYQPDVLPKLCIHDMIGRDASPAVL